MFKGASLAVAASMLIACVPAKEDPGILRRISAVENGSAPGWFVAKEL